MVKAIRMASCGGPVGSVNTFSQPGKRLGAKMKKYRHHHRTKANHPHPGNRHLLRASNQNHADATHQQQRNRQHHQLEKSSERRMHQRYSLRWRQYGNRRRPQTKQRERHAADPHDDGEKM